MILEDFFHNGSKWLRVDFHLHTKSDTDFIYNGDDNFFISNYIDELKKENISIGVITNHNKFNLQEFKKLKKYGAKNNIILLPGVEFSITDGAAGIHLLIVFSYEWYEKEDCINSFLSAAFAGIENGGCYPYPNSKFNLQQTYDCLNNYGKDYFFVLAHVDDKNGLFKELHGRHLEGLINSEAFQKKVLAFQQCRNNDNDYNNVKSKIAHVEGSDNARSGIDGLGKGSHKTYIKLGDTNFDALKIALRDYAHRVKTDLYTPHNSYIKNITINGAKFNSDEIGLSPYLNTMIGIRGSGKSALLEVIRYALEIKLPSSSVDISYKNELIKYVLGSGGKVILTIVDSHKKEYRIEKILGQKATIYNCEDDSILNCSIDAILDNVVYYGQNDLSSKEQEFQSDLLSKLISRNKEVTSNINNLRKLISEKLHELRLNETEIDSKNEIKQQCNDLKQKLSTFEKTGVKEKLKLQTQFNSDKVKIDKKLNTIKDFHSDIQDLYEKYEEVFSDHIILSEQNKNYQFAFNDNITKVKEELLKLDSIEFNISKIKDNVINIVKKLDQKEIELQEQFSQVKRELNTDTIDPDTYLNITRQLEIAKIKLEEIEKQEQVQINIREELNKSIIQLNNLWHQQFTQINDKLGIINDKSDKLNISIEYKGDKKIFLQKLHELYKGSGLRDNIYQYLIENYCDFIDLYQRQDSLTEYVSENNAYVIKDILNKHLEEVLTFEVPSKIVISYNGKKLDSLSMGQRASALILFLMSQDSNNILIIDQPEDDLDNQVIYNEVIAEILKLKGHMQFIFATHNPNIPVLGNSEKVIAFENDGANNIILTQGTIDTPLIQNKVVKIMEGGKDAFDKRNEIYNNWKVK